MRAYWTSLAICHGFSSLKGSAHAYKIWNIKMNAHKKASQSCDGISIQEYANERTCSDGSCDLVMNTISTNATNLPPEAGYKTFLIKDQNGNVVQHVRALSMVDVMAWYG